MKHLERGSRGNLLHSTMDFKTMFKALSLPTLDVVIPLLKPHHTQLSSTKESTEDCRAWRQASYLLSYKV